MFHMREGAKFHLESEKNNLFSSFLPEATAEKIIFLPQSPNYTHSETTLEGTPTPNNPENLIT